MIAFARARNLFFKSSPAPLNNMSNNSAALIQKVWTYAHVLKDDGLAFMDYTEQITYLLFLKMAWEQREAGASEIPSRYNGAH